MLLEQPRSRGKYEPMKDHRLIDERSLAFDRLTARKLAADPSLVEKARDNVNRWLKTSSPRNRKVLLEWQEILSRPIDQIIGVLLDESEEGKRLRQSSPFAGVLSQEERMAILKDFQSRDAIST